MLLTPAPLSLEFFDAHQPIAGAGVLDQFRHALAPVEVFHRRDNRLPLGGGARVAHSFRKYFFWNIHGGFHDSNIPAFILQNKLSPPNIASAGAQQIPFTALLAAGRL